ncbi:hypothetical protein [Polyangium fumosum]|uniref:Uncharacterized protein n=1 Tax=Polyangium fumosum TaxID=889272 RepID=A0A4V6WQQ2_9BACT|nr:hypothetical protein [Polyangium fumosum]TKD03370.1 hypothetical protein E8A74_25710 [Polyangium fumosum]
MSGTTELDSLMARARSRVWSLYGIVAGIVAFISMYVMLTYTPALRWFLMAFIWCCGCVAVLGLGYLWVRARVAATRRLMQLVSEGALRIANIDLTKIELEFLPFGAEVDIEITSGEHLAFGFWLRDDADALVALLRQAAVI